jgi:hypothetical protein
MSEFSSEPDVPSAGTGPSGLANDGACVCGHAVDEHWRGTGQCLAGPGFACSCAEYRP